MTIPLRGPIDKILEKKKHSISMRNKKREGAGGQKFQNWGNGVYGWHFKLRLLFKYVGCKAHKIKSDLTQSKLNFLLSFYVCTMKALFKIL